MTTYINKKPPALRQQGQAKQNFKHVNDNMKGMKCQGGKVNGYGKIK